MPDSAKELDFEVVFETEGRSVGKMRNEITVTWAGGKEGPWEMATDEGVFSWRRKYGATGRSPTGRPGSRVAS